MLSDAQLTSPGEVVCVGKQVVFVCQRDYFTRWSVFLPGGTTYELRVFPSQAPGTILTFQNDTSFGFKIHVLSSSSDNTVHSELRVTAVRQINGTTVECEGRNGFRMSTIQIASAGKLVKRHKTDSNSLYINVNNERSTSCSKWSDDNC